MNPKLSSRKATYHLHAETSSSAASTISYLLRRSIDSLTHGRLRISQKEDLIDHSIVGYKSNCPQELSYSVELAERRKNACHGRSINIALPRCFGAEKRRELVTTYSEWINETYGAAVLWAIHHSQHNPHAHLFISDRKYDQTSERFTKKIRELTAYATRKTELKRVRKAWETTLNNALVTEGIPPVSCAKNPNKRKHIPYQEYMRKREEADPFAEYPNLQALYESEQKRLNQNPKM